MSQADSELPDCWIEISTADTFKQVSTNTKNVKTKECQLIGKFPVIDQGQMDAAGFVDDISKVINVIKPLVIFGDHTRVIKWVDKDFVPGADGTKVLEAASFIEPRYFYYQLKAIELPDKGYSRHFRYLNETSFRVAPLAEQQQIAAKLDELLTQVDTLKTRLDTIPKILKRFRQSVLAAATSGKLTEDWRAKRASPMQAHGESGKVIGNSAPIGCVVDSALLTGWRDVRLADISDVQGGVTKDAKKQLPEDEELPYLRVANVQRGYLDLSEIKTIRVPAGRLPALLLEPGDVLFNEGGDIDKLGRGWVWEGQIERCTFQNHVFRARLYDKMNQSKYISWWGNFRGLSYFLRGGKQTTNLASINKSMLSNLPISLPPPEEQTEIVRRVEQLFTYADQIEQRVKDAQARVNHLTQSILAKAFRGELTAGWREQNPDLISGENSAEALLAKIKAEREKVKSDFSRRQR
jgi:type I restriction enzyme S subunit